MSTPAERTQVSANDLVTVAQAAADSPALGERFLRRLIAERRVPVVRIGRRVFLRRCDLDALAAEGYTPQVP